MGFFDFMNNVPQNQNDQSNQPPPIPWNTRTPVDNTPSSTPASGSNWNGRVPFSQPAAPEPAPSVSALAPTNDGGGNGGGFFQNLWGDVTGAMSGIGNALTGNNDPNQPHGMDRWQQAAQDMVHPGQMFQHTIDAIKNIPAALAQGVTNPDQATQGWDQGIQKDAASLPTGAKQMLQYGVGGLSNPFTIIPVGKVAEGIRYGADAAGITPYVSAAVNAAKNSPVIDNKVVNGTSNFLGNLFNKYHGASPDLVNALTKGAGAHSANEYNVLNTIKSMTDHGLSPSDYNDIGHVIEGTVQGTPEQQAFAQKWNDAALHGPQMPQGSPIGTKAMLNTASAVNGDPILRSQLPNYFPHRYDNVPDELKSVFPKQVQGVSGLSPDGIFNLPRTFDTLQDAQKAGLKPNLDPLQVLGSHLSQSSKALTNNQVISDIKNTPGLLFAKDPIDEAAKLLKTGRMTADQAAAHLGMSLDDMKKGFVQSKVPQLSGAYIRPADEAALNHFLTNAPKNSIYDKAISAWKQVSLMNATVHGHNIAYNGGYLGGANPVYVAEHGANIVKGATDPWVDRAMRAGAGSSDSGSFSKALKDATDKSNPLASGIKYALHGSLWDADKAMRTSLFRQAVEGGATDSAAAAHANKFLVDYGNTTPFENSVMKRAFPFYSWMKGNLPLQAEQWVNNTPKQMGAFNAIRAGSDLMSGNDAKDGKMDTGQVLSDGSHSMIDPYIPGAEPSKVLRDGIIPFLYSKINPLLKEPIAQVLNKAYYPSESLAPNGKESMANATISNPEAPGGYNALKRGVHAANSILPLNGVIGSLASGLLGGTDSRGALNNLVGLPNKDKPPATATELITKALGGFSSRDNPAQDAKGLQYNQKDSILNHIKYEKEVGIPISRAEKRAAYRKVR